MIVEGEAITVERVFLLEVADLLSHCQDRLQARGDDDLANQCYALRLRLWRGLDLLSDWRVDIGVPRPDREGRV